MQKQKPMFVLSPCGTSLLTNQGNNDEKKLVRKYANQKEPDRISQEDRTKLELLAKGVEDELEKADLESASKMSAELNSVIKLYNGQLAGKTQDVHMLLCTDTWLGETAAKLVAKWLEGKKNTVVVNRQKDIQTEDITSFKSAL